MIGFVKALTLALRHSTGNRSNRECLIRCLGLTPVGHPRGWSGVKSLLAPRTHLRSSFHMFHRSYWEFLLARARYHLVSQNLYNYGKKKEHEPK